MSLTCQHRERQRPRDRELCSEYTHQIGATELWLRLTLQLSTPLSLSIHLPPTSRLSRCSAQSYWYTVCPARWSATRLKHVPLGFNTPLTNPPPSSRWHAVPGSSATGGLHWYQCVLCPEGHGPHAHVFGYAYPSVFAFPQALLFGCMFMGLLTIKWLCVVGSPWAKCGCCGSIWTSYFNPSHWASQIKEMISKR